MHDPVERHHVPKKALPAGRSADNNPQLELATQVLAGLALLIALRFGLLASLLAGLLVYELVHVRSKDSKIPEPPLIARVASDLLDECRFSGHPPGPQLSALIQELLGSDLPRLKQNEKFDARDRAIWIYAHMAQATLHQVARAVGVAHTTVRNWLKDEQFQKRVQMRRAHLAKQKPAHTASSND
jgi:hypothetical protein